MNTIEQPTQDNKMERKTKKKTKELEPEVTVATEDVISAPVSDIKQLDTPMIEQINTPIVPPVDIPLPGRPSVIPARTTDYQIEIHQEAHKLLDTKFGKQIAEKSGKNYTGRWVRPNEGKFIRNLLKLHEKQVRKFINLAFRNIKEELGEKDTYEVFSNNIYVLGFAHKTPYQDFATVQMLNPGLVKFLNIRIVPNNLAGSEIKSWATLLMTTRAQMNMSVLPFVFVTDWNAE